MRLSILLLCVLVSLAATAAGTPMHNVLSHNPSPYLALHGEDPTAWQEWNAETVARARREHKLLFISIGYFSCHWCHVMQRESYRNPEIARLINANFIPVKVDRELDVGLDARLQAFARATRGYSGWPLNVFVTPEGELLFAILYAPPGDFLQTLSRLAYAWRTQSAELEQMARQANFAPPELPSSKTKFSPRLGPEYRQHLVREALATADSFRGGFGKSRKFPYSPQLAALIEAQRREPDARLAEFLRLTLDQMVRLGLHDAIAGGFFRYTVDPDWHTPHYEKMLYDNAQLASIYLDAARILDRPDYRRIGLETLDFMLADMRAAHGAFIASTSAVDGQDREGGVYLWQREDLRRLLTADEFALVTRLWRLDEVAASEYGYLPMLLNEPTGEEARHLQAIHAKLRRERSRRELPKDDKLLAGMNGLALSALSRAAGDAPAYRQAARRLHDFLVDRLIAPHGLVQGEAAGRLLGAANLEDYAYVSRGLLDYARLVGGDPDRDRSLAQRLVTEAWRKFHRPQGWSLGEKPLLARPYYQPLIADDARPSPSAVLIAVSLELGDKALRAQARQALGAGLGELDDGTFWYATQVSAMSAAR